MPGRDTPDGRFTAARSRQVLGQLCARLGLDDRGAEPIKLTVNAVYRLPREAAIVRIASSTRLNHRVAKVVRIARWLADQGMPAVRLLPGVPAPVEVEGHLATVWRDATPPTQHTRPAQRPPAGAGGGAPHPARSLAEILLRLHALAPPDPPLPTWDPLDDVRRRLADAEGLGDRDRRFLEDLTLRVADALGAVSYALPRTVVHGDAHLGNLIHTASGEVVICDFDATCLGPAEWDLVPVAVGTLRFGRPSTAQDELARAYRFDVTAWDGFPALRAVRELKLVTSVVPILASSPSAAAQFAVRLESLRAGSDETVWAPYR
ncbi:putative homoserine kinase type II (protein kinase fold) [Frankia sp. EI5c]|uniref:aminoglycoside phosphotransferase family protein n=1 Tax=Frankia sp. EI5c TaxID=683316 RepID=UPI0007C22E53|nr:aminoglycoside phosphotransferase family protein [Frankia sp. EI5c]OAA18571.1 putative homoserine kinase type II (protein kinase fold) [Frankia sp. EI5c]